MAESIEIGSRIECEEARGTIKWIGELVSVNGQWFGIDWDEENRGKHDGSYNGIKYFNARSKTSGSFVRPTKINLGMTLEDAVRGRYQGDPAIEEELKAQLKRNIKARFVEVVGMEKVGQKQSGNMLQLPESPESLVSATQHITHLVLNRMRIYSWDELMICAQMFPFIKKIQLAYNSLETLGLVPTGVFDCLEDVDVGANPLSNWSEICNLGSIPKLSVMNLNNCKLMKVEFPDGEKMFSSLSSLMIANNPLLFWDSLSELDKLPSLEELVISPEVLDGHGNYFLEFTFARIRSLKILNRTVVTPREKRDHSLFYLRTFSNEYYLNGGSEAPELSNLTPEFAKKHPSYLQLVKVYGAPVNESQYPSQRSQKLRDLQIELRLVAPNDCGHPEYVKSFLPSTRISKLKMMIKRLLKINGSARLKLSYCTGKASSGLEIVLDNDMQDLQYYSVSTGDTIYVRW